MLTDLLKAAGSGDESVRREIFERMYAELHAIARRQMRSEREDHTLGATSLVHELYLRLHGDEGMAWESREQFFGYARACMAHLLIDHARRRNSKRRGGEGRAAESALDPQPLETGGQESLAALDQALETLRRVNPRASRVLELRCLAGLEVDETARLLGIAERTVVRDWQLARALLSQILSESGDDAGAPLQHAD